jgi:hypothetical protein
MCHTVSSLEPLEARIAPAALLPGGKVATFTDIDGDLVTVKFSKPILTAGNVGTIFAFTGSMFSSTGPQKLASLNLANLGAAANGVDITISAKRSATTGGNGFVDLVSINASDLNPGTGTGSGIDLGKVIVKGNIDSIDAGDANLDTPALKSADLLTLGAVSPGTTSTIYGKAGTFKVRGTLLGNLVVNAFNPTSAVQETLASLIVGGSIGAGFDAALGGHVEVFGNLLSARVAHDLHGGTYPATGYLKVYGDLGKITVGGSVTGGTSLNTGVIDVVGRLGSCTIRGDVAGDNGIGSGYIKAGSIGNLVIGGDLRGYRESGLGAQSGNATIVAQQTIDSVTIGGSLIAGNIIAGITDGGDNLYGNANDADMSGAVVSKIGKVIIKGNVQGSSNGGDAFGIEANQIGMVKVGAVTYRPTDPLLSFSTGISLTPSTADVKLRTL